MAVGFLSRINGIYGGITIANGVIIENASGGSGNDTIYGNSSSNRLDGGNGNDKIYGGEGGDTIIGGAGNDLIEGGGGADLIDGGLGTDEAAYAGPSLNYMALSYQGSVAILSKDNDGADILTGVESIKFTDRTIQTNEAMPFAPYEYLATYSDLVAAFGSNIAAAFNHFINYGFKEGRTIDGFDGMQYPRPMTTSSLCSGLTSMRLHVTLRRTDTRKGAFETDLTVYNTSPPMTTSSLRSGQIMAQPQVIS